MNKNYEKTTQSVQHIRDLIGKGEIESAISQLFTFLENNPKVNEAILQSARFSLLLKEIKGGTISYENKTLTQNQIIASLLTILDEIEKPAIESRKKRTKKFMIFALIAFVLFAAAYWYVEKKSEVVNWSAESSLIVKEAYFSLDLTKGWENIDKQQLKVQKKSKGIVYSKFKLVKFDSKVKYFAQRLGTTSIFLPEWESSTHKINPIEDPERKCSPEVKHSYVLYFDIEKAVYEVPFDLDYTITFWNAHNGESGDWQSQYISFPTENFLFEVIFPPNRPCKNFELWYAQGIDCTTKPIRYDKEPIIEKDLDANGNIKRLIWKIDNPNLHWIYSIQWQW
jgi:hypothetical protein